MLFECFNRSCIYLKTFDFVCYYEKLIIMKAKYIYKGAHCPLLTKYHVIKVKMRL